MAFLPGRCGIWLGLTALAGTAALAMTTRLCAEAPGTLAAPPKADGWKKISDEDGIIVYEKDLAGSDTISLRGEAVIDASVDDIAEVMKDNSIAADWVPYVAARRTLKPVSVHERIEYTHISMPWPMTDRYFINTGKAEYLDHGALRLFIKSVDAPDPAWLESDKVLGLLRYSEFMLTPLGGPKRTHLALEVNTDPKGLIPKWLVNLAQESWPRDFVTGLIGQLRKRHQLTKDPLAH